MTTEQRRVYASRYYAKHREERLAYQKEYARKHAVRVADMSEEERTYHRILRSEYERRVRLKKRLARQGIVLAPWERIDEDHENRIGRR